MYDVAVDTRLYGHYAAFKLAEEQFGMAHLLFGCDLEYLGDLAVALFLGFLSEECIS